MAAFAWPLLRGATASAGNEDLLAGALSGMVEQQLIRTMGGLEAHSSNNWGNQAHVWTGKTKVVFQGIKSHVEKIYDDVDHGLWTRSTVAFENAADNLDVKIRNFRRTGKLEITFQIYVRGVFRGSLEARAYNHGVKLATGTFKGRATAHVYVDCRCGLAEESGQLVLRNKVEAVDIKYSDVVLDRAGVFGGYSAQVIGDAFTGAVKKWFSDKEKEALEKAKLGVRNALGRERRMEEPARTYLVKAIRYL